MEASLTHLASHFGGYTHSRVLEMARREHWFIKAREDKKRKDADADRNETDLGDLGAAAVLATPTQIEQFEARLDELDAATVEALEQNRIRIDDVQQLLLEVDQDIQWMLGQAHVMEDGRRVFLTRARTQAFDEFGTEVMPAELDFDLISDGAPAYEDYAEKVEQHDELQQSYEELQAEQDQLIKFQERLDEARERVADEHFTADELDSLDHELDILIPQSVVFCLTDQANVSANQAATEQFTQMEQAKSLIIDSPRHYTLP